MSLDPGNHSEIVERLVRIETLLTGLVSGREDHELRLRCIETVGCPAGTSRRLQDDKHNEDIETRLRALDRWRWSQAGMAVVAGASVAGLSRVLGG
jgi:hypothetical protein